MTAATVAASNAALIAARDAAAASGTATTTTTTGSKTDATTSQNTLSSDVNFFLTMLTTQLKNQDPSSPMDTNQFTQQIAQYSGVQQQVTTNSNLEKLIAANNKSAATTAVGYIGKEVETAGKTGEVIGGQGAFSYILPSKAATATITITDSTGATVFSGAGATDAGRNIVVWDGVNSTTGAPMPDGVYTIAVTATDAAGKTLNPETRAVAIVSGVETDASGNTLLDTGNNTTVNFNDVLAVRVASRASVASTAPTPAAASTPDTTPTATPASS